MPEVPIIILVSHKYQQVLLFQWLSLEKKMCKNYHELLPLNSQ